MCFVEDWGCALCFDCECSSDFYTFGQFDRVSDSKTCCSFSHALFHAESFHRTTEAWRSGILIEGIHCVGEHQMSGSENEMENESGSAE